MTTNSSAPPGTHKEKQFLLEIGSTEKQLWALIHSKGLLHSDVQELYRKVRSSYEVIILNNHPHSELQDAEYCLWKLHYKHIDEFRKRIKKCSGNAENKKPGMHEDAVVQINNDNHIKAFKSFLSEASEFYQNLTVKLRKHYGVPEEALFYKKGWIPTSSDPEAMLKCRYLCHRCMVCMGDLARYKQQHENLEIQNQNWSVAAMYYLEATRIWPDSGNPQNQLAVLATYIGDDFLALYYCVRSLAVKEPFPDAWDNLIFLLEKNRSSHLHYVAGEVCFDSFKPSAGIAKEIKAQPNDDKSNDNKLEGEINHFMDKKLWPLFVRTMSFLLIPSSNLEEFPIALASTIGVLDTLMELQDTELKTILESNGLMDLARKGPFRALQIVSTLIFAVRNLIKTHETSNSDYRNDSQQLVLIHLALPAVFGIMGRFVERCLKATHLKSCPLLPSVLVFVEWSASMIDVIEVCATDEKSIRAISYLFDVLVELLNQLSDSRKETNKLPDSTPLWEDYELRGFVPLACSHSSLDFSCSWENIDNFESGIELRTQRMTETAMKIASRSTSLQKWITYDALGRKFCVARQDEDHKKKETDNVLSLSNDNSNRGEEPNQKTHIGTEEHGKCVNGDSPRSSSTKEKSSEVEEEEVILFRPLTRYNSAPSYPSISTDERMPPKDKDHQSLPSDDCLHRTTSLLMAQNPSQSSDPCGFHGNIVDSRSNKSLKQQEALIKESNAHTLSEGPIHAGPPSLSSWVLDRNMGTNGPNLNRLHTIDEAPSSYMAGLSINKTENSVMSSLDESLNFPSSCATCYAPAPSAPFLPDNAAWFTDVHSTFPAPPFPNNPSPISSYADWNYTYGPPGYDPSFPAYSNGFPPQPGRMTSSEWLRRYRENYTLERVNNQMQPPTYLNVPGNHENYFYHDTHRFNQYGGNDPFSPSNQFIYTEPPVPQQQLQPVFPYPLGDASDHSASLCNNFQRPSPYGCGGAVTEMRSEPQTLLEYLKEKEWRLQRDPNLPGPTFMGN